MSSADFTSNPLLDTERVASGAVLHDLQSGALDLDWLIDSFVRQPLVSEESLLAVEGLYLGLETEDQLRLRNDRDLVGIVGYCTLSQAMDFTAHRFRPKTDVQRLLRDRRVIAELLRWYRYQGPELECAAADPVCGTTSFIIRCRVGATANEQALKLLLPRYVDAPKIAERTAGYRDWVAGVPHVPAVYDSQDRYIRMDWVDDPTLEADAELLPRRARDDARVHPLRTEGEFANLRAFALSLLSLLDQYDGLRLPKHPDGVRHLDLSPSNLFVRREPGGYHITLIDFGVNYLVQEKIGTTRALVEASLYMAPEVRKAREGAESFHGKDDERRADLYSLGMLFLQVLTRRSVTPENAGTLLRDAWEHAPGWARIIEDLVAEAPSQRVALMPPSYATPYQYVCDLVRQEDAAIDLFGVGREPADPAGAPAILRWYRVRSFGDFKRIRDASTERVVGDDYPRSLAIWAAVAIAWWVVNFLAFVDLTLADLGAATPVADILRSTFGHSLHFGIGPQKGDHWGNLKRNLPGRLVGLTFGMCAVAYYINIFSTLSLRSIPRKRLTAFFMRATAWFPGIPIAVLMFYEPHLWPYMSFAGAVPVIVNNFLLADLARQSAEAEELDEGDRIAETHSQNQRFREIFVEWWILMLLYGAFLAITGIFIDTGVIPNTWYFALVVIGVNYPKLYRLNSVNATPRMRGNLQRAVFVLRRKESAAGELRVLDGLLRALDNDRVVVEGGGVAELLPRTVIPSMRRVIEARRGTLARSGSASVGKVAAEFDVSADSAPQASDAI